MMKYMSEVLKQVIEILKSDPFNVEEDVSLETKIKDFSGWDSLKQLMFLIEVEKRFNIEITAEEVISIITISDLVKKIQK